MNLKYGAYDSCTGYFNHVMRKLQAPTFYGQALVIHYVLNLGNLGTSLQIPTITTGLHK